jgi:8-oxo-dGTP pyrophosphatase MutT (NUDIX family)
VAEGEPSRKQPRAKGAAPAGAKRRRRRRRKPAAERSNATTTGATSGGKTAQPIARDPKSTATRSAGKRTATTRKKRRKPPTPTKREVSAGGVVYRREGEGIEVALASRRTRRGQLAWGLAKGGIEENESTEDAAIREVREETGLKAEIEASLGETRYFYVWEDVRIRKTVHFFLMRHTGGDVDDRDDEMEEIRWFPLERALKRAAYRGEREVLGRAAELLR